MRDKIVIVNNGAPVVGFADWAEQLIAESTGKSGTGVLPVVVSDSAPELTSGAGDILVISLVPEDAEPADQGDAVPADVVHAAREGAEPRGSHRRCH